MQFMFEELERIGALIGHIDQLLLGRQLLGAAQPQQALARFPPAVFGQRFVAGNLVAVVEDLIHQAQHLTRVGGDCQHVLADVALAAARADLSQVAGQ
jgi:hypothetical protein